MKIQQFETSGLSQYAYVVSSESEAIVIDPMRDFEQYLRYAAEHDLTIRYVTETHIHADFASGAEPLAAAAKAELLLSGHDAGERYRYTMVRRPLRDNDEITLGKATIRILHTPGHTPEHVSFVLFEDQRSTTEPVALFTGDFLFVGSVGRPDLLGEEEKQRLAHELFRSLHHRLAPFGDGVAVYPGHGAGSLCGSGMSARSKSTLGYERRTQPLFALDEEAFVKEVLASVPPMPAYYPRMKVLNSQGAADYRQVSRPRALLTMELEERVNAGSVMLLDLRRPEGFGGAHIPGALNIGAGQNLSLWAGWMLDPEIPVVLISDAGEVNEAVVSLLRVGLDHVEGYLRGGMSSWLEAGLAVERTTQLSVEEVQERASAAVILDVRNEQEWNKGHIVNAQHVALGELAHHLDRFPIEQPLIAVCGSGYRSSIAASLLQHAGWSNLSSMSGGMTAWNKQRLPVSSTNGY